MKPFLLRATCAFVVFLSLPLCAQSPRRPDRGFLSIPVRHLLFYESDVEAPRMNTLLMADDNPRRLLPETEFQLLQPDQLVELVRSATGKDLERDGVSLQFEAGTIMATGPKEVLTAVEKTLAGIAEVMCRRLRLEARLYEATGNASYPAVIRTGDLRELTQNLPMLWQARAASYSGQQVAMAQERFTNYVREAEVEVANKAKIGNPQVEAVFEGVRLLVESHALVGGKDAVVMCQFAIGDLKEPIAQRTTGVAELSALGTPKLDCTFGSFGGRLRKGDALAVRLQSSAGSGSNLLLVLKVDDDPIRAGTGPQNLAILPVSALTSGSLLELTESFDEELDASTGHLPVWNALDEDDEPMVLGPDQIVELLSSSLNLHQIEDASVDHAGGYILLRAGREARSQAIRLLETLENQWLQTVEVRTTTTLTRVEGSAGTLVRPAAKEESRRYQSVTLPTLLGRSHLLVKGVETCTTRDFEAEIAEESAILDPVVVNVFSGIALNITPIPGGRGGREGQSVEARLKLHLSHVNTDSRRPTEQKDGGDLFLPKVNRAYFARNDVFELGVDAPLGWGPVITIDKQRYRMHQSIRLRKP